METRIIKRADIVAAMTKDDEKNFQIGDYITDRQHEDLYLITDIRTRQSDDKKQTWTFYHVTEINPITLQPFNKWKDEGEPDVHERDLSLSELNEYYFKICGDIIKLRDMAHGIMFENASIEDYQESSETALMTLGDKQSLIALREQAEEAERSIQKVKNYCELVTNQMKHELEQKIKGINGLVDNMNKEIKKFTYVIQTIETYTGISEEIIQLADGEPASESEPIVIRQAVIFCDEELALIEDDFDWQKMEKFDTWLLADNNFKRLLPDAKSIVALKPRRTNKEYASNDAFYNAIMNRPNHVTLFLIRNGDKLYKLESEHIYLEDRMFPNQDEYMKQIEKEATSHSWSSDGDKESDRMRKRFTKIAFLLQGLLDRSDVFSPHHVKCSFLKMEGLDNNDVKMEYELDHSHLLTDGRLPVMDWIRETNKGLKEGSRILLIDEYATGDFLRYYSSEYTTPSKPGLGIYTVKKNPQYRPDDKSTWYDPYKRPFIISYLPNSEAYSWSDGWTERKNKVSITLKEDNCSWLLYDSLDIETLDYYLNSRLYRSQYFSYVKLLKTAKLLIAREEADENNFAYMLTGEMMAQDLEPKDGYTHKQIAQIAIDTIKNRLKWKRPITSKEKETYTLIRRTLFSKSFKEKYFK